MLSFGPSAYLALVALDIPRGLPCAPGRDAPRVAGRPIALAGSATRRAYTRLRWQAERPGALWHGDVCHGPTLKLDGRRVPVRVHGMLDDASRYVVALRVASNEREQTMLTLLSQSLMEYGKCDALYLDNGARSPIPYQPTQ
ncbi:MAG: DDE-type integrase/transposase/recombinase [Polyangiaceae bacterium]